MEILFVFSLKTKRLQWIAGLAPKKVNKFSKNIPPCFFQKKKYFYKKISTKNK
jgi:hypothetical protein